MVGLHGIREKAMSDAYREALKALRACSPQELRQLILVDLRTIQQEATNKEKK